MIQRQVQNKSFAFLVFEVIDRNQQKLAEHLYLLIDYNDASKEMKAYIPSIYLKLR